MKNLVTVGVFVFCVVQMTSAKGVGLAGDTVGRVNEVESGIKAGKSGVDGSSKPGFGGGRGVSVVDSRMDGVGGDTIREVSVVVGRHFKGDTIPEFDWEKKQPAYKDPFPLRSFVLPATMITYGATALHSNHLQSLNREMKEEVWMDNPHKQFHLDNYLMFAPALTVYALNIAGVHGKHNFKDRTILLLLSNAIAQSVVFSTKGWTHELRPSGNDYFSFPSGHTAEAFANAEFMRMEYKDVSTWYVVGGYAMATATGMLRMYNNAHWMSDVIAGAGVGMASTRLAYWLYPKIQHWFGKGGDTQGTTASMLAPTYSNGALGLSFVKVFK